MFPSIYEQMAPVYQILLLFAHEISPAHMRNSPFSILPDTAFPHTGIADFFSGFFIELNEHVSVFIEKPF